jgi:hypothetical protein
MRISVATTISAAPDIEARLERLAKRARKLEMELTWSWQYTVTTIGASRGHTGSTVDLETATLHVSGQLPHLDGWRVIAAIQPADGSAGNLVWEVDGAADPAYRFAPNYCDHCHTKRRRNMLYAVRHDDRELVVGKTCLRDYTGSTDIEAVVKLVEALRALEGAGIGPDMHDELAAQRSREMSITEFLAWVAQNIAANGWVSRARADDWSSATVDSAMASATQWYSAKGKRGEYPNDMESELAEDTLSWVRSEMTGESGYAHNLRVACSVDYIDLRDRRVTGLVASAVAAYQRARGEKATRASEAKSTNEWVGEIKQRLEMELTVVKVLNLPGGQYGSVDLIKFRDTDGRSLCWFSTSRPDLEPGDTCTIKGTVKAHKIYQGTRETQLTRCKVISCTPASDPDSAQEPAIEVSGSRDGQVVATQTRGSQTGAQELAESMRSAGLEVSLEAKRGPAPCVFQVERDGPPRITLRAADAIDVTKIKAAISMLPGNPQVYPFRLDKPARVAGYEVDGERFDTIFEAFARLLICEQQRHEYPEITEVLEGS